MTYELFSVGDKYTIERSFLLKGKEETHATQRSKKKTGLAQGRHLFSSPFSCGDFMNDLLDSLLSSFLRLQSSLFSSHMSVRNARRLWLLSLMHHRGVQREHINLFRIESGLGISTRVTMAAAHGGSLSHTDTRIRKGVECVRGRGYFIGSALNDPAVRRYLWAATTTDPKKQREKKKEEWRNHPCPSEKRKRY